MRENKEITTIFDPRRTGGANISSSGGVRGGRPTPPSVVIVTAPPQENVAPLGEPTEVEGLMANGPSLAAPSNQNCPQVLAPPSQSSSSMQHQPSGAGGPSMAPIGTCNSHPADHNQSQPTCTTLTNNRRVSALQSLQNFKKSCCSRSARKMYCGVCVTVCVTASWVGATHSIKYLYHLGPSTSEPLELSNKVVEVLDSQTTSSYALPSSSDGVISLGPSLAPGASSTRLVPATKVSPLYDAPFFTTWFCTNWTILFFPIYAIGHYLASPCSSKTSSSDIQGDAEINPGQSKRSCCSSYSSCCSCLRRSEEGREEDNSGARASSSSSSTSSDEEGNTRGSSSPERRGTEQRGEEETTFPGGEMSSPPRRRPQTPTQCCFCMCRSKKEVPQHHHHHHHHKNSKQHCDLLANTMQRFRDKGFTPARFLTRCSLFCLLWVAYNYMYVHSLRILFSTDAMALYATHACCVYLLSWVLLHHQFVGVRIVAVITCDTGIALLAYMDGITGSPTLGGVVLAACAAAGSAVYKVLFKKVMGEVSMGQIALFFSLVGLLNALLLWPLLLALYLLGAETFLWNELPWLELLLTGALSLLANLFSNFSVAVTYDLFITLGFITAVPVSAALDVVLYGAHFAGMKLAGIVLISVGFFLVMFPDNWPDYITRLLRWSRRQRHGGTVGQRRDVVDYRTGYIRSHLRSPSGRVR